MPLRIKRNDSTQQPGGYQVSALAGLLYSRGLSRIADRIFGKVLLISEQKLETILHIGAEAIPGAVLLAEMPDEDGCDYPVENGIACIEIHGTLVKRASGMNALSGMTSYESLKAQIAGAMEDPDIKGLLFDVDSPGGEADGMFDLADFIYNQRGTKPMFAVADSDMYSAAYAIGSCVDQLYVTRTGGVGSIGCYMLHADRSGLDKQIGVKYTYIYAGDHKVDGNPHEPLGKDARAEMQNECNRIRDMFVTLVARNRNATAQQIIDTQAGCFYAQSAIPLLADKMGTLEDARAALMQQLGIDPNDVDDDDDYGLTLPGDDPAGVGGRDPIQATAIPPHKTATSDKAWDGPANEARLKLNQDASYYKKAYAWYDAKGDLTKKSSFKFIHHDVSAGGDVGAANVQACRTGIGVLNGARGGTTIPASDRKGVYNHLAKHLKDAGVDAPPLRSLKQISELALMLGDSYSALAAAHVPELIKTALKSGSAGWADMELPAGISHELLGEEQPVILAVRSGMQASVEAEGARKISMLAVPYDGAPSSNLGGFKEIYQAGCFAEGLNDDPRVVFNHDYGCILGRTSAGTARFWEDAAGVHAEADAPETQWANDLLVSMRRRDIDQASAAFFILKYRWEMRDGERFRIVERALMREASVYAFPAYESTTASVQPASPVVSNALELDEARLQLLKLRG